MLVAMEGVLILHVTAVSMSCTYEDYRIEFIRKVRRTRLTVIRYTHDTMYG